MLFRSIAILKESLDSTASAIGLYGPILEKHIGYINEGLENFKDKLRGFDFDIGNFVEAASMIAFAPENPAMWGIQAANVEYQGGTEVKNDQGVPVNKDYIVHRIDTIEGDLKIISESAKVEDDGSITVAKPGDDKLIADKSTLDAMLDQFYNKFPGEVQTLKNAIQQYVNLVIERNNMVMQYNACVSLLSGKYTQYVDYERKLASLNDKVLEQNPDLPAATAFASDMYHEMQQSVVYILNMTARTYRLWTLSSDNLCTIRDEAGNPPLALNYDTLKAVYDNFYKATIINTISAHPPMTDKFSPSNTTANYIVKSSDYFGDFKYGISFSFQAQKKEDAGSFSGMSQVRIDEVRVYLIGAKLSQGHEQDDIALTITHGTQDTFVTSNNRTTTFSYAHPLQMPFHYKLSPASKLNSGRDDFEIPVRSSISTRTDWGLPSILGGSKKYPVMGPFTSWTITVDPAKNPGLAYNAAEGGFTDIIGVVFEFKGVCSGFE